MRRLDVEQFHVELRINGVELTFCGEADGSEKMDFVFSEYLSVGITLLCVLFEVLSLSSSGRNPQ